LPTIPADAHDFSTYEPDILDESMTRADLVYMLENLNFRGRLGLLRLDRGVRDFLIDALRRGRGSCLSLIVAARGYVPAALLRKRLLRRSDPGCGGDGAGAVEEAGDAGSSPSPSAPNIFLASSSDTS
jgi:hypothetical protein